MSQQNTWTEENEHTLDMIRSNSVNLSEKHYEKYKQYRRRLNYVKYPVIIMSTVNAYAALGLPQYVDQYYVSVGNTTVSFLVVLIVLFDMCMGTQKKLEKELIKHIEYKAIGKQIYDVLSLDRIQRKIDPTLFLDMKFNMYQVLTEGSEWIQKMKHVVVSQTDKFMISPLITRDDPIPQTLQKHWNILFQPATLKSQSKKIKDVESQKEHDETKEQPEISTIYDKKETNHLAGFFRNPFKSKNVEEGDEDKVDETTSDEKKDGPIVEFIERVISNPTSPRQEKKFGMAFMNKL